MKTVLLDPAKLAANSSQRIAVGYADDAPIDVELLLKALGRIELTTSEIQRIVSLVRRTTPLNDAELIDLRSKLIHPERRPMDDEEWERYGEWYESQTEVDQ